LTSLIWQIPAVTIKAIVAAEMPWIKSEAAISLKEDPCTK
jgi:hypothetical protein